MPATCEGVVLTNRKTVSTLIVKDDGISKKAVSKVELYKAGTTSPTPPPADLIRAYDFKAKPLDTTGLYLKLTAKDELPANQDPAVTSSITGDLIVTYTGSPVTITKVPVQYTPDIPDRR